MPTRKDKPQKESLICLHMMNVSRNFDDDRNIGSSRVDSSDVIGTTFAPRMHLVVVDALHIGLHMSRNRFSTLKP